MEPKDFVGTFRTSPSATYARSCVSAVLCRRKNVMSPGMMSPSSVPCVTSSGRLRAMIFWYFIEQNASFFEQVLPQWKPMKVSLCVYGVLSLISALNMSAGTVLLMSSSVTASRLTQVPMNSESAP